MTAMTARRMTRATWYKHRFSVVGLPAVFLLAALALLADSVVQRHWLSAYHLTGCLAANATTGGSWCGSTAWASFSSPGQTPDVIAAAVLALPGLAGLFAGVPWVAREFETGAFRFTWTQGTGPRHWLLGTFGPLVLLATVSAAIYGTAAYWWYQVAQWQAGTSIWSWRSPSTTTYTVQTWLQTPSGQQVSGLPAVNNVSAWIAQHHYTFWVAYQPHNHLIWLELARNGILITVAALAVLASVWWLRIRPAD
jgi:hypothetical protein